MLLLGGVFECNRASAFVGGLTGIENK